MTPSPQRMFAEQQEARGGAAASWSQAVSLVMKIFADGVRQSRRSQLHHPTT